MRSRMNHPAMIIPEAMKALQALARATENQGVPTSTINLVHLRASQINGCSFCVGSSARSVTQKGESVERLLTVAAWREAPYFTDASALNAAYGGPPTVILGPGELEMAHKKIAC